MRFSSTASGSWSCTTRARSSVPAHREHLVRTSRPGQSALLLLDVVERLVEYGTCYAVIGAVAASIHGVVRASLDADALLSVTHQELKDLENELKDAGFKTELRRGDIDDPIPAVLEVTDAYGNRVDLLGGLRGLDPAAFSRTIEVPFAGTRLQVIGREDFIAMKVFAGGPQDIVDARNAIDISRESLDLDLLRKLALQFGRACAATLETLLTR